MDKEQVEEHPFDVSLKGENRIPNVVINAFQWFHMCLTSSNSSKPFLKIDFYSILYYVIKGKDYHNFIISEFYYPLCKAILCPKHWSYLKRQWLAFENVFVFTCICLWKCICFLKVGCIKIYHVFHATLSTENQ